ncbi:MAG: ThuA domain-containing protein [Chloroflexota bacterium]|nr:ThuA domain-containing protein [Dehalococcoidia bacterium]MDW8252419.1 ThuA domain-containing protein [Chloroflexota bacterium]
MSARISRRTALAAPLLLALAGCARPSERVNIPIAPIVRTPSAEKARVLVITATYGFRHDSIPAAIAAFRGLADASTAFTVTATEDLSVISQAGLMQYDVLVFCLTSGELPLSNEARAALLGFVAAGGGFLGFHSATDTLYRWPEYGALVGAYFKEHPWVQPGGVIVEDSAHPATEGLGSSFTIREEFYTFRENPRPRVHVLLRLDAASVGASGDFPLAWCRQQGAGRVYYNALGHFSETWADARFQRQVLGAIRWAAGHAGGPC